MNNTYFRELCSKYEAISCIWVKIRIKWMSACTVVFVIKLTLEGEEGGKNILLTEAQWIYSKVYKSKYTA